MAGDFTVTIREQGAVRRSSHATLLDALDALERELRALGSRAKREAIDLKVRRFEPVQQVAARGEITASGIHAGVDVRGDGSAEAFTGRWRRRLVAQEPGESAYTALRRALGA